MSLLSFAKKISGRQQKESQSENQPAPDSQAGEPAAGNIESGLVGLIPLVTEKSVRQGGDKVTFRVGPGVSKPEIARAVQVRYGVKPLAVRTIQMRGKQRQRGRTAGSTAMWKKAYVTLPAGESIDITA